MTDNARLIALILAATSPRNDPAMTLAYRLRAAAILRQWETASEMQRQGLDIGVYAEAIT